MATDMSSTWNILVVKPTTVIPKFAKKPVLPTINKAVFPLVSSGYDVLLTSGTVPDTKTKRRRAFLMEESSGKIVGTEYTNSSGGATFRNIEPGLYKVIVDGNDLADGDGGDFITSAYDKISVP